MVVHEDDRESLTLSGEGIKDIKKKILAGPRDGYNGYLRHFTLGPGGHSPLHSHDWYHVAYILGGRGKVLLGEEEHPLEPGTTVYVRANLRHHFVNTGGTEMRFLCLVPEHGDAY